VTGQRAIVHPASDLLAEEIGAASGVLHVQVGRDVKAADQEDGNISGARRFANSAPRKLKP
jgi:hypothetical protein